MKSKLVSMFLAMLISLSVVEVFPASALSIITSGDFKFVIRNNNTVMVYSYSGNSADVVLPEMVLDKRVTGIYADCFSDSEIESVTIPESYTHIGEGAFYNCKNLRSVNLPMLENLGDMAFAGCTSLTNVKWHPGTAISSLPYGVFAGDTALVSIKIPNYFTEIGEDSFKNCTALENVTLPSDLTKIGESSFAGCTSLKSLSFPPKLDSIGDYAFSGDNLLSSFELPYSLTSIGVSAFENNSSLTNLFIPETVTSIGANAFSPMSFNGLIEVTCYTNSYSAKYCRDNYFLKCNVIDKLMGDTNLDGSIDIMDVTLIQKYKVGLKEITSYRAKNLADINDDGEITLRDASLIQMKIVGLL